MAAPHPRSPLLTHDQRVPSFAVSPELGWPRHLQSAAPRYQSQSLHYCIFAPLLLAFPPFPSTSRLLLLLTLTSFVSLFICTFFYVVFVLEISQSSCRGLASDFLAFSYCFLAFLFFVCQNTRTCSEQVPTERQ